MVNTMGYDGHQVDEFQCISPLDKWENWGGESYNHSYSKDVSFETSLHMGHVLGPNLTSANLSESYASMFLWPLLPSTNI